ncbi:MAG: MMPL family transporter, partial [Methylobacteriaceae bacterium]|nr:MMPL family transporter [Methylobacteriaceae bacterium]
MRPVEATVAFCARRPWIVIAASLLLALLGSWLSVTRFAINTDTARLISPSVPWRATEVAFDRAFPGRTDLVLVVIDATTPEQAGDAATRLTAELRRRPDRFRGAKQPDGTEFFARNGFLYLTEQDLRTTLERLEEQREILALFASDQTLRGFSQLVTATVRGVQLDATSFADLAPLYDRFAGTIEAGLAGRLARLSWRDLSGGRADDSRALVLVRPVLDYAALQPGAAATTALRETADRLGLTPANGITLRLTGPVPLADEEFGTIAENIEIHGALTLLAVLAILWLALRSAKLIAAVLVTLLVGLVVTSGLGLLLVGQFNLISVAFFALFIGLGVDFGIQFAVRYRADRFEARDIASALRAAARGIGFSLTLAALSLIAGFLSFLPTAFLGVSELGLIAGLGMAIAYAASVTLLPALIAVLRPPGEREAVGTASLAAVDRWIERRRWPILAATAVVIAAGMPALVRLRFDSDPMNLRNRSVESVSTYDDLRRNPDTSPITVDVVVPSLEAVPAMAARLEALPEVERVVSLLSFVPEHQDRKLALIAATREALLPAPSQIQPVPPPSDAERVEALRLTAGILAEAAGEAPGKEGVGSAQRLAKAFAALAEADPERRDAASRAVTADFPALLTGLRTALAAERVTREDLPPDLVEDWMSPKAEARIEVSPKPGFRDGVGNLSFARAVQAIAPDATGAPVTIAESGRTIVEAFVEAGIFSLVTITLILWIAMRRLLDVLLALGPLVLAGVMTLQAAQLVGLDLNF